jgi:hypothetical protein
MTQKEATETHYQFCELADKGEIEDEKPEMSQL